jgi:formylglycine-generating enzyme required for sulfatase activity
MMGSPAQEADRLANEGPRHQVVIAYRLAVTEAPITRGQFRAYVQATGRRPIRGCNVWNGRDWQVDKVHDWERPGFAQTDEDPVVCVSWYDAQAFAGWLSRKTAQRYRLLSEAEWEFAARAGSDARYAFGDNERDLCAYGNVADRAASAVIGKVQTDCNDGFAYTAPVRSFRPNAWGLYDVHGNVWQWVQDCFADAGYQATLTGGLAMHSLPCRERVLRGGGWNNSPKVQRVAFRDHARASGRHANAGLRLARVLP